MQQLFLPLKFGRLLITRVADPAVATNFEYAASNTFVEQLVSVEFVLTADANPANRAPFLELSDSTGVILTMSSEFQITAGNTILLTFQQTGANHRQLFGAVDVLFAALPPETIIPRGGSVNSRIENIQVGDQISSIVVVTHVWARP